MNSTSFDTHRGTGLRLATLWVAAVAPLVSFASELTFDGVFNAKGEPGAIHFQATYLAGGGEHRLEVWREGDLRLKRRTDDAIETYAFHRPGDPEYRMSILDLSKRIHTRIDRTNLYRIGNFTDWFDLAHGLKHPRAGYRLIRAGAPAGMPKAIEGCEWYELTQDGHTVRVCWSVRDHIPLLIQASSGKLVWRVVALDRDAIPAATFAIHDEGFVRNDANGDIEGD